MTRIDRIRKKIEKLRIYVGFHARPMDMTFREFCKRLTLLLADLPGAPAQQSRTGRGPWREQTPGLECCFFPEACGATTQINGHDTIRGGNTPTGRG